jgi:hypothetical protein
VGSKIHHLKIRLFHFIVPKSAAIFVMLEGLYSSVLENGATLVSRESLQTITR